MTSTSGLRINMPVRLTYARTNGSEGGYDGVIQEIETDESILVKLDSDLPEAKPQYRTFKIAQIVAMTTGY